MDSLKLKGVRVDKVTLTQAVVAVDDWLIHRTTHKTKKVIATPNFEFLIDAQKDFAFREILNHSDLNIPDSARFGWLEKQLKTTTSVRRFFHWFLFPFADRSFPNTTGVELVEALCELSSINHYSVGFYGGTTNAAAMAAAKMVAKYPGLKIAFADPGVKVDLSGKVADAPHLPADCDILFVALGHRKQEKWIDNYKKDLPARVFMGVGGSFDYLSGNVSRAPKVFRQLGLEWLFRLINQPWRIFRQLRIASFVLMLLFKK